MIGFVRNLYRRWLRRQLRDLIEREFLPPGKGIHELPLHEVRRLLQAGRTGTKLS